MSILRTVADSAYRSLFENSMDGVLLVRPDGRVGAANPAACEMFGMTEAEMFAAGRPGMLDMSDPRTTAFLEERARVGKAKAQLAYKKKDGSTFIGDVTSFVEEDGINAFVLIRDVTSRKAAEEELVRAWGLLQKTFASLNEAVFIVQTGTSIIEEVNSAAEEMFGYPREELLGRHTEILHLTADMGAEFRSAMAAAYEEKGFFETTYKMRRKDGTFFHSEHSVTPLRDHEGRVISHVCVVRNVSDRIAAEETIRASLAEKEILLKEIHHRVKNNLLIVTSLLALQARKFNDKDLKAALEQSIDRINAMALVHEILYSSDYLARIALHEYLRHLASAVADTYSNGVKIELSLNDVFVDIDHAVPCGLIFNELLTNAFVHGFPESREGTVRVHLKASDDDGMSLSISHDGKPLPTGFSMENSETLGLRLVTLLAQQVNGRLQVEPESSTFVVAFSTRD